MTSSDFGHAVALRCRDRCRASRVGRQQPRPDAEHDAAARHVIELDDAVRDHQRVVIGQRDDAGAEPDALGALGRGGDEQFGRGDDLEAGRVMLADPGLVVSRAGRAIRSARGRGASRASDLRRADETARGRCRCAALDRPWAPSLPLLLSATAFCPRLPGPTTDPAHGAWTSLSNKRPRLRPTFATDWRAQRHARRRLPAPSAPRPRPRSAFRAAYALFPGAPGRQGGRLRRRLPVRWLWRGQADVHTASRPRPGHRQGVARAHRGGGAGRRHRAAAPRRTGVYQPQAVGLYRGTGFRPCAAFGAYAAMPAANIETSLFFEKSLRRG